MTKTMMLYLILPVLTYGMQWSYWQQCQHSVTLTWCQWCQWPRKLCSTSFQLSWLKRCNSAIFIPLASCNAHKSASVAPHWFINLMNGMVPLMTLLASHDTDTNISVDYVRGSQDTDGSGITWPKCHVAFPFIALTNGMVPLMTLLALWDTDTSIKDIK